MKIADASFIPSSLEECFEALERMTSEEEQKAFLARGRDKVFMLHHSTGRWIRNNWGLWKGSALKTWFEEQGVEHADDMSGMILRGFWDHLQKKKA